MGLRAVAGLVALIVLCPGRSSDARDDGLVGHFYRGDGLGEQFSLEISQDGRFKYVLDSDVGNIEKANGQVELLGDRVRFSPAPECELKPDSPLLGEWVQVRWGRRLYLIGEREMLRFTNHVNRGAEPRSSITGRFLLRRGDNEAAVDGLPILPVRWRGFVLRRPVGGVVTRLLEGGIAEVNLGQSSGLHPGMVLMVTTRSGGWSEVTVQRVEFNSSVVTADLGEEPLHVGQRVTSRP